MQNISMMCFKIHPGEVNSEIVRKISYWANADPKTPPVYWLNKGNAEENKAIAWVIAERMSRAERLGASFFCS
jgi:hypothetical protein